MLKYFAKCKNPIALKNSLTFQCTMLLLLIIGLGQTLYNELVGVLFGQPCPCTCRFGHCTICRPWSETWVIKTLDKLLLVRSTWMKEMWVLVQINWKVIYKTFCYVNCSFKSKTAVNECSVLLCFLKTPTEIL